VYLHVLIFLETPDIYRNYHSLRRDLRKNVFALRAFGFAEIFYSKAIYEQKQMHICISLSTRKRVARTQKTRTNRGINSHINRNCVASYITCWNCIACWVGHRITGFFGLFHRPVF
jgi:hypothetical protein